MKTFVINLERRQDRKENINKIFPKNFEYEFFKATDGKYLKGTNDIYNIFLGNDFNWRRGVIGCALSHYNIWKKLLDDTSSDYYCIFEDDISLSKNFEDSYEKTKIFLNSNNNIDILFLGYHMFKHIRPKYKDIYDVEKDIIFEKYKENLYIGGFFSYFITKSGAKKLLDYINVNGIKHGIDYLIKIHDDLNIYETRPHIVKSDWVDTVISKVDSDIQKDFDKIVFDNTDLYKYVEINGRKYKYYQGLDAFNNDIRHIPNKNILQLEEFAQKDPECLAFNSLGYFKNKVDKISTSPWIDSNNGIYVKIYSKIRVKMLCNWCSSFQLCKEWNHMTKGDYIWNNIEITWTDINIDYYVVINKPMNNEYYNPQKTIIFQMEPWCYSNKQNWGVKTWGEWAKPDPKKFLHIHSHDKYLNVAMWQLNATYKQLKSDKIVKNNNNIISSIVSPKYFDPGHIKRVDFLKYIEQKDDPLVQVYIYGKDNVHNFKNYKGQIPDDNKDLGITPYKYYFMCENNSEKNYITEKLWEPILTESLCFYWGCPNADEYIDSQAFITLKLDNNEDFEKSFQIIRNSILNNLWEERLQIIQKEKEKILEDYSFFPLLEKIIKEF